MTDTGNISVSARAAEKIKSLIAEGKLSENHFLRVSVKGGGCSGLSYNLDFDSELKQGDQVFENDGVKVICDLKSFLYLAGTQLDFSDGLNGKGFSFINPNASRTCGCGESFAV
ncbi:MAG: iron-sulfur cluster assembly accessory protein [Bacteroidia bacterium]|nr:iron-sulfur cluster assembly accessory protein [Bacteroidia bacterium]